MKKFQFSSSCDTKRPQERPIFSGHEFYGVYKEAHFLKNPKNIETILSKGYELRQMLKLVSPGEVVALEGMVLYDDVPVLVKKTGPKVEIKNYEITANRLNGLTAAYAFENRLKLDKIISSEAESLGLKWDGTNTAKCRLYLSAVSGTEHFYEQFHYWPLVCALRKFKIKKINLESVVKIAKIKTPCGIRMAGDLIKNMKTVEKIYLGFPNAKKDDLPNVIINAAELRDIFLEYYD